MQSTKACNQFNDTVHEAVESSKEFVKEHALSTSLGVFGIGLATGVAIVYLISDPPRERYDSTIAQKLGRHVLDAMASVMPDSLAKFGR